MHIAGDYNFLRVRFPTGKNGRGRRRDDKPAVRGGQKKILLQKRKM
jgi:hypothetical protein